MVGPGRLADTAIPGSSSAITHTSSDPVSEPARSWTPSEVYTPIPSVARMPTTPLTVVAGQSSSATAAERSSDWYSTLAGGVAGSAVPDMEVGVADGGDRGGPFGRARCGEHGQCDCGGDTTSTGAHQRPSGSGRFNHACLRQSDAKVVAGSWRRHTTGWWTRR